MAFISVVLFTVNFAVLHSILARLAVKSHIRRAMGDRAYEAFYRLGYNALSVITFAPIFVVLTLYPGPDVWNLTGVWVVVVRVVQLIGMVGLVASLVQIDGGRFLGTKQVMAHLNGDPLPLPDEPLTTSGVYGLVRHPLYFFSILVLWFTPSMSASWLVFVVLATVYFLVGSLFEERTMLELFGEPYREYQQRVPWMLPFVK
ncbi:MAG: isoprenylcysteine carboxylmethyltransferase family protein [Chloroflexota bacterium]